MRKRRFPLILLVATLAATLAAKKKNPDDFTQTLALPKEPPTVAVGETRRLIFHVSPLSGKGLLSQQTRDALKSILKDNGGVPVVHIRAFVAGSGDIRRVPQIVSEFFTEKKMALPAVSVVLAGGLPLASAQVVLEAVSVSKRDVNTEGLRFAAGSEAISDDPSAPIRPLLETALTSLAASLGSGQPLQVSCFVSALSNPAELSAAIYSHFPSAATDLVQSQRAPYRSLALCEGVSRGGGVTADTIAFTGTRVAFGGAQKDASLAFQRLDKDLTDAGALPAQIAFSNIYALSGPAGLAAQKTRTGSIANIPIEGLASMEAGFAVDAIAPVSISHDR